MAEPRPLPTVQGSVIGWSMWYDGPNYGCAMLERDGEDEEQLVWYLAGIKGTCTQEEMAERVGKFWQDLGTIDGTRRLIMAIGHEPIIRSKEAPNG